MERHLPNLGEGYSCGSSFELEHFGMPPRPQPRPFKPEASQIKSTPTMMIIAQASAASELEMEEEEEEEEENDGAEKAEQVTLLTKVHGSRPHGTFWHRIPNPEAKSAQRIGPSSLCGF